MARKTAGQRQRRQTARRRRELLFSMGEDDDRHDARETDPPMV
jgi:hypothetical protein